MMRTHHSNSLEHLPLDEQVMIYVELSKLGILGDLQKNKHIPDIPNELEQLYFVIIENLLDPLLDDDRPIFDDFKPFRGYGALELGTGQKSTAKASAVATDEKVMNERHRDLCLKVFSGESNLNVPDAVIRELRLFIRLWMADKYAIDPDEIMPATKLGDKNRGRKFEALSSIKDSFPDLIAQLREGSPVLFTDIVPDLLPDGSPSNYEQKKHLENSFIARLTRYEPGSVWWDKRRMSLNRNLRQRNESGEMVRYFSVDTFD